MSTILSVSRPAQVMQWRTCAVVASVAFFVPFTLGGPQVLVGTIVNAALIYAAFHGRLRHALPIVLLPGLAVLSRGVLFGSLTPVLSVLLPYIWLGNLVLVACIQFLNRGERSAVVAVIAACVAKTLVLYASAWTLAQAGLVPSVMVRSMGGMQLLTALAGAAVVLVFTKSYDRRRGDQGLGRFIEFKLD